MWLLPALAQVSALAVHAYYRLTRTGAPVPREGPVLLVGNHPNSLFDPAFVVVAAGRPVRFLAKAPLLKDRAIGWLVRGAGAIPVYRPSDDPALVGRNEDSFRAAHEELARGAAVGIFPEGISHSHPGLVPLKTGAARIALGAAARLGRSFPIIPVGLVLRDKERFRSEALVVAGEPIRWDDLLPRAENPDSAVVRELTTRIHEAMRAITVNFESWEDAPLIEAAAAIYVAEYGGDGGPDARAAQLREAAAGLARLRREGREGHGEWAPLARDVARHARILATFGLTPASLKALPAGRDAVGWTLRQMAFFALTGVVAGVGMLVYYLPYRLLTYAVPRTKPTPDLLATYYTLGGALLFGLWVLLLALAAGLLAGGGAALALLLALPPLGAVTQAVRGRWLAVRQSVRRFLLLRTRAELRRELVERQREIAAKLRALREALRA